jgi:drug/metabolite transporter (DMT)-like permease
MALVQCRDCSEAISTGSRKCQHCGARSPSQPRGNGWLLFLAVLAPIVGPLLFLAIGLSHDAAVIAAILLSIALLVLVLYRYLARPRLRPSPQSGR